MEPKIFYRYSLNNRLGLSYVSPFGESDFVIEWSREDEEKLDYKKEFPSKVKFTGDTFNKLLKLEKSVYRCEFTEITIERNCGGAWVVVFIGRISLNDSSWDLDRCNVIVKVEEIQPDQCYEDNKNTKINLFSFVGTRQTVKAFSPDVTIEKVTYTQDGFQNTECDGSGYYWNGAGTPTAAGWVVYNHFFYNLYNPDDGFYTCHTETSWARQKVTIACGDPSPGLDWILLSDTCPGGEMVYVKPVSLYSYTMEFVNEGDNTTAGQHENWLILGDTGTVQSFDNGMKLADVFDAFLSNFCPGKEVVSNFFQINAEVITNINYVTGQISKVDNIIIFQKSDVKRPAVSGNATIAEMNMEDFLNSMIKMFNVRWRVVGNVYRVEHISFFAKNNGINLTIDRYKKAVAGLRRYSYETQNIPQREEFKFMEASSSGDFPGVPITYSGACVSTTGRNNVKTFAIDNVTTDVELCINNPDPKSSVVEDKGFVYMATKNAAGQNYIITEAGILGAPQLNNPLAWAQLHRDYHRYYRPLKAGLMNNTLTTFFSVLPTKKGDPVTIPLCCDDVFNPDDIVTAPLGAGTVSKATFNFKSDTLTLELLFDATAGLTTNAAPVAVNDTVTYAPGETAPRLIDVLANDTDADGPIESIEVVITPLHGTAEVTNDLKVLYTPTLPITAPGVDNFVYIIKDEYGEASNQALVSITFNA